MTDPARREVKQIVCSMCTGKRFFLYMIEGEAEFTCVECGVMSYVARQIPAQP